MALTLTYYEDESQSTTDTLDVASVVISSGDGMLIFFNQAFNGTPYPTTVTINGGSKTFERMGSGTGNYENKGIWISPTNLNESGTYTVTVTFDSSFYGGILAVITVGNAADTALADKPSIVTGTGTSATQTTTGSMSQGCFIGILGSSDNIPNGVGSGDTNLGTLTSFAGGAYIIYEENTGTVTINGTFSASSSYFFDAGFVDEAAGGGGPTVIPPARHTLGNQFNPITAARLNGVLH